MEKIALCRLQDVPDLQPLHVKLEGASAVSVFRTDDAAAVTDARCPHKGAPLSRYAEREGATVVCLWHSCRFDLFTGMVLDGPCPDPLKVHACEVEDDVVYLRQA